MGNKPVRRNLATLMVENPPAANQWEGREHLPDPIMKLRDAEPARQKPRNRAWEKEHRGLTVRGIPAEIRQAIKDVAYDNGTSSDVVAQAFLEYALECYTRGELKIQPVLDRGRRTLIIHWEERKSNPTPPAKKKRRETSAWKQMAHYRLPAILIEKVKQLSNTKSIGRGDLMTYALTHALSAYKTGKLILIAEEQHNTPLNRCAENGTF